MALAIFDLDDTIIDGSCDLLWNRYMIEKGYREQAEFDQTLTKFANDYQQERLIFQDYVEFVSQSFFRLNANRIEMLKREFTYEILTPLVREQVIEWMENHHKNQDIVTVCTASFRQVSSCIMALVPADHLVATQIHRLENQNGYRVTKCYEEQKPILMRELFPEEVAMQNSWGYSDSVRDVPLLNMVDHAVAVNPCEQLRAIALKNQWEIRNIQ